MSPTPVTVTNTEYTITGDDIPHSFKQGMAEIDLIARAEKAEAECLEQARLLGMSREREADLLGKISRLHSIIERASVQFFHEGTDGETAVKMLTILTKAKHELNAGVNKQDL